MVNQQNKIQRNEETRVDLSSKTLPGQEKVNIPFAVLSMGAYSGDKDLSDEPLEKREPTRVDSNNLDQVMADMGVVLNISVENALDPDSDQPFAAEYRPKKFGDLTPDGVVDLIPELKALKDLRTKLKLAQTNAAKGDVAKVLKELFDEYKDLVK